MSLLELCDVLLLVCFIIYVVKFGPQAPTWLKFMTAFILVVLVVLQLLAWSGASPVVIRLR